MAIIAQQSLGSLARGNIGPKGPLNAAVINLVASGRFLRSAPQQLIGVCSDERCDEHGERLLLPAGFGGFAALVQADALTIRHWYKPGMTFREHALATWRALREQFPQNQVTFAVHTDSDAERAAKQAAPEDVCECGCAAIAQMPAVFELLVAQQQQIDPRYRAEIVKNAQQLLQSGYAQPNTQRLVEELEALGLQKEVAKGLHNGVILFKNEREGTVLDRPALYKECAKKSLPVPYAFAYDAWAMRASAKALTNSPAAAEFYFSGGDALAMATIRAIGTPELVVVTFA